MVFTDRGMPRTKEANTDAKERAIALFRPLIPAHIDDKNITSELKPSTVNQRDPALKRL